MAPKKAKASTPTKAVTESIPAKPQPAVEKIAAVTPSPNPVGRPPDYDPAYCERLVSHMERGYSFESFAGVVNTSRTTLYNWEKAYPEFLYAKEVGQAKGQYWWEQKGIAAASGAKLSHFDPRNFNLGVWNTTMKNRFGYRDRMEVGGDPENPVKQEVTVTVRRLVPKNESK